MLVAKWKRLLSIKAVKLLEKKMPMTNGTLINRKLLIRQLRASKLKKVAD